MDKSKFRQLYAQGKTDPEIAKELQVSRSLIQAYRKQCGLPSNFSYNSFRKMDYDKVKKLVAENKTDKEIAEIFNVKPISVYFLRKRNSLTRDNLLYNKSRTPTKRQWSIIVGSLLGDASLRKTNVNPSYSCEHSMKQLDYCKWKYEELKSLNANFHICKRKTPDKRNGKLYESAVCRLPTNPALSEIYNYFYDTGVKKIVSEIFPYIDELALAVWFMDDGYKTTSSVAIATNCFTEYDLLILIDFLQLRFNLTFHIFSDNRLYLLSRCFQHFKDLILPYMRPELLYKVSLNCVNLEKPGSRQS